jgi:hypothetical protein
MNISAKKIVIGIVVVVIIIMGIIIYFQRQRIISINDKYETHIALEKALHDSIRFYQNKEKEWVAEKLTIQESIKNLEKINDRLNSSQKELLSRIKEIEKNSSIIVAALIETNVKIDKLKPSTVIVNDSNVVFIDSTENLKYNIEVGHVKPINIGITPTLTFNKFDLPNKQFIEFHWKNDKKLGYPIAFSVSNSNKYFKTVNIESYAIPNLKKKDVDPNGWNRFAKWMKEKNKVILTLGIGVVGGITAFWLLSK